MSCPSHRKGQHDKTGVRQQRGGTTEPTAYKNNTKIDPHHTTTPIRHSYSYCTIQYNAAVSHFSKEQNSTPRDSTTVPSCFILLRSFRFLLEKRAQNKYLVHRPYAMFPPKYTAYARPPPLPNQSNQSIYTTNTVVLCSWPFLV